MLNKIWPGILISFISTCPLKQALEIFCLFETRANAILLSVICCLYVTACVSNRHVCWRLRSGFVSSLPSDSQVRVSHIDDSEGEAPLNRITCTGWVTFSFKANDTSSCFAFLRWLFPLINWDLATIKNVTSWHSAVQYHFIVMVYRYTKVRLRWESYLLNERNCFVVNATKVQYFRWFIHF